jgi:hypothetical protein
MRRLFGLLVNRAIGFVVDTHSLPARAGANSHCVGGNANGASRQRAGQRACQVTGGGVMPSINAPTLDHIKLLCRHAVAMMTAGITENFAIRLLELMADNYAKFRAYGNCSPNHVDQCDYWSKAARKTKVANPKGKSGLYLRVEHGTPRRDFARDVLAAHKAGKGQTGHAQNRPMTRRKDSIKDRKHRVSRCDDCAQARESRPDGIFGKDKLFKHHVFADATERCVYLFAAQKQRGTRSRGQWSPPSSFSPRLRSAIILQ